MAQDTNQNRPADVAQADSVGGMAKRLLNPAHLSDLARRSAATLKEQGAEQLWRDVTFRVGLAFHHDSWQHRADLPLRRELKALQREMELWADSCAWFLLDAGTQGGGHGVSLDWTSLASLSSPRPWFLAGGLSSASLNRALEQCSPDGIDLNSGVEAIPGQKSPQKLLAALKPLTPYTPYHIA